MLEKLRKQVEEKSHPSAKLWPLMSDDELRDLAEDIKSHGLKMPIFEDLNGKIVDGRNRYIACWLVGITPNVEIFTTGQHGDVDVFVASMNDHRRHMSREDRNGVIQRMIDAGKSTREIAKAVKVGKSTVARSVATVPNGTVTTKSPQAKRISDELKSEIYESRLVEKKPIRDVAEELGVSTRTVQNVLKEMSKPKDPTPAKYTEEKEESKDEFFSSVSSEWCVALDTQDIADWFKQFVKEKSHRWSNEDKALVRVTLLQLAKDLK